FTEVKVTQIHRTGSAVKNGSLRQNNFLLRRTRPRWSTDRARCRQIAGEAVERQLASNPCKRAINASDRQANQTGVREYQCPGISILLASTPKGSFEEWLFRTLIIACAVRVGNNSLYCRTGDHRPSGDLLPQYRQINEP